MKFSDSQPVSVDIFAGSSDDISHTKRKANSNTQTDPIYIREGGIQTVRRKQVEIQTDISAAVGGENEYEYFEAMDMPNDDPQALNMFVRRIGPLMLAELDENAAHPGTTLLLADWATDRSGISSRKIE